jgi:pimeloyl-ACP methyl ester carboxylesterase
VVTTTSHPVRSRTVPVAGTTVSLRESGGPAGPAAVLLHGGSSSAATWDRLATALTAAGHHVIAADLRGHGGSSRARDYPLHGYSDDIRDLMDALEIGSAALVGHSLGGYAASVLVPALAGLAGRRGYDRRAVTSAVRQLRMPDPAWWDRLPLITAPTLLISGGPASHIPPRQLAEAAGSIPHSRIVTIAAGHRVHSLRPEQFLAAVMPFLTG